MMLYVRSRSQAARSYHGDDGNVWNLTKATDMHTTFTVPDCWDLLGVVRRSGAFCEVMFSLALMLGTIVWYAVLVYCIVLKLFRFCCTTCASTSGR